METEMVAGAVVPLVVALLKQRNMSEGTKVLLMLVVSVVVAVGMTVLDLTDGNGVAGVVAIVTTSIATYHGMWKPMGVAPAIEEYTYLGGE